MTKGKAESVAPCYEQFRSTPLCVCVCALVRPNAAFDLCGLCCGAFKMPFWKFFGATLLGKAFVKVNMQVRSCVRA